MSASEVFAIFIFVVLFWVISGFCLYVIFWIFDKLEERRKRANRPSDNSHLICSDCKFYRLRLGFHQCHSPHTELNPVDGTRYSFCDIERKDRYPLSDEEAGTCGRSARFFEPKDGDKADSSDESVFRSATQEERDEASAAGVFDVNGNLPFHPGYTGIHKLPSGDFVIRQPSDYGSDAWIKNQEKIIDPELIEKIERHISRVDSQGGSDGE